MSEDIPSGFLMSTIFSFRIIENKHDVYTGKDYMKKVCESLREHVIKIIHFKKKILTKEQQESYENAKFCYICKEKFQNKYLKDRKYRKVNCHYTESAHSMFNLKYSVRKKNSYNFS